MNAIQSSAINLYDPDGSNHFQAKILNEQVRVQVSTIPINFVSTKVGFTNIEGQSINDIVTKTFGVESKVDQEALDRAAAVTAETSSRTASDTTIQSNIDQEVADRVYDLSAEANERSNNDTNLQTNIDQEATARGAAVTLEMTYRVNEDTRIEAKLDQEITDRATADTTEATARASSDTTLQESIGQIIANRITAVTSTASTRLSKDTEIEGKVDQEITDRTTSISNEITARTDADSGLSLQISAEETARLAEVAVERLRIDTLLDGTSVNLNQLQELITAYQTADSSILSQISVINTSVTALTTSLASTESKLDTLLANTTLEIGPTYITFPSVEQTNNTNLLYTSDKGSTPAYAMWNYVYHPDVEPTTSPWKDGWLYNHTGPKSTISVTNVDGSPHDDITGVYNAFDLQTDTTYTNHKIQKIVLYASMNFPQNFAIIGSNDGTSWVALHEVTGYTGIDHAMTHIGQVNIGIYDREAYKYQTTFSNDTVFRYVGIIIISGLNQNAYNQSIIVSDYLGANELILSGMTS